MTQPLTLAVAATPVDATAAVWVGLLAVLAGMIVIDLKVGSARAGLDVRTAAIWSAIWVGLSIVFGVVLWSTAGAEAGEGYFAGYVMEKALSLDNVFVFTLIFAALAVPRDAHARLLLYGILIALLLRAIFIFAGAEALERYSWVAFPFAALLAWTGYRILRTKESHDEGAAIVERIRRRVPMTDRADAPGLFVREGGRRLATPALAALAAVALADIIFAVDSVPAILAITTDTFVVFAANAFALLGLRALFFLVGGLVERFRYLKLGLGVLLITIAAKLVYGELTGDKIPTSVTLATIGGVLVISIGASLIADRRDTTGSREPHEVDGNPRKRGVAERLAADLVGLPFVTRAEVATRFGLCGQGAINAIKSLAALGILEPTGLRTSRGALYVAREVVDIVSA